MILECPCCHRKIEFAQKYVYHAGFSNVGVAYCTQCGRALTFSTFDKVYQSIVPDKHPWSLTTEEQRRVESRLKSCKCGGRFSLREHPRCPYCWCNLSELLGGDICYVRFPGSVDGDEVNVWRAEQTGAQDGRALSEGERLLSEEAQNGVGGMHDAPGEPVVVYRYALWRRGWLALSVALSACLTCLLVLELAGELALGIWPHPGHVLILAGFVLVLAFCFCETARVFSRVELYRDRLVLHRPFRLRSLTLRFDSPFEVTERRAWWYPGPTWKHLRISGTPDEIRAPHYLRGYKGLKSRLEALQANHRRRSELGVEEPPHE